MYNHATMVEELKTSIPGLSERLSDPVHEGLLYNQLDCFAEYTQEQIESHNEEEVKRCFDVAHRILRDCDPQIKEAMYLSYIQGLDLADRKVSRSWAKKHLSPILFSAYEEYIKGI